MIDFINKLKKNSYVIDQFLDKYLPIGDNLNSKLFEAMRYSSINSGKKIRAFLVIESGKFLGLINNKEISQSKYDELVVVATAIEAIHTYSLISKNLLSKIYSIKVNF